MRDEGHAPIAKPGECQNEGEGFERKRLVTPSYRIISLCGVDGVGKSTQAQLLANYLKDRGISVSRVWIRSPHTGAYIAWKVFQKLGCDILPVRSSVGKRIWLWLEFASVIPKLITKVMPLLRRQTKLVADRFLLDTLVTACCLHLHDARLALSSQSRALVRLLSSQVLYVHLTARPSEIIARRLTRRRSEGVIPTHMMTGVTKEEIEEQESVYRVLTGRLGGVTIDTTGLGIQRVHEEVIRCLMSAHHPGREDLDSACIG